MSCSHCNKTNTKLIEVHVKDWAPALAQKTITSENNPLSSSSSSVSFICGDCLVGWNVPVYRSYLKRWEFGSVEDYNPRTTQHFFLFIDDSTAWETVDVSPFNGYMKYCKDRNIIPSSTTTTTDTVTTATASASATNTITDSRFERSPVIHSTTVVNDKHDNNNYHIEGGSINTLMTSTGRESSMGETEIIGMEIGTGTGAGTNQQKTKQQENEKPSRFDVLSPTKRQRRAYIKGAESPNNSPRTWTAEEDTILLKEYSMYKNLQLKWPKIAKALPGRTGKQCRERYLNHLRPTLKLDEWTKEEDALIFRLHYMEGSKWASMSKVFKGRSDNNIKNRYHNVKRRFERRVQAIKSVADIEETASNLLQNKAVKRMYDGGGVDVDVDPSVLRYVAYHVISAHNLLVDYDHDDYPKTSMDNNSLLALISSDDTSSSASSCCRRCGLFIPSKQTGQMICTNTGWCENCCTIAPNVHGDLLRLTLCYK